MKDITQLIRSLKIPGTLKGLRYLARSTEIAVANEDVLFNITKQIYPIVAEEYNVTTTSVERNIRTVITICWERCGHERLSEIVGYELLTKPTTGEMIDFLANYVRKHKD